MAKVKACVLMIGDAGKAANLQVPGAKMAWHKHSPLMLEYEPRSPTHEIIQNAARDKAALSVMIETDGECLYDGDILFEWIPLKGTGDVTISHKPVYIAPRPGWLDEYMPEGGFHIDKDCHVSLGRIVYETDTRADNPEAP